MGLGFEVSTMVEMAPMVVTVLVALEAMALAALESAAQTVSERDLLAAEVEAATILEAQEN